MNIWTKKTMKTQEFRQNYELDTKAKGVRARERNLPAEVPEALTADSLPFDPNTSYFFFDESGQQVRQTLGMRRSGEYMSACGLQIVPISKLRAVRDDALSDGQTFFKMEMEKIQARIAEFELEKSADKRSLKAWLMAKE